MKYLFLIVFFVGTVNSAVAQTDSVDYSKHVESIDAIIETLYDVISGPAGEERNWELFHYLFKEGAQLIPTGLGKDSIYHLRYDTPANYVEKSGPFLLEHGFFEQEIHRSVQRFGNIVHVFSTYQCFKVEGETEPFMRGINSIQLIFDGSRWWVVNIYWAQESEITPIPAEYLPKD